MKKKILVVVANYYKNISTDLTNQAKIILLKNKLKNDWITVPGVFEIPVIISKNIKPLTALDPEIIFNLHKRSNLKFFVILYTFPRLH